MYRPKGWKNPDECLCDEDWVKAMGECGDMRHHAYEAGADAMLEGLKKGGVEQTMQPQAMIREEWLYKPGTLVFIPEE